MDGAPYLRKIDLKVYKGYPELLKALENMFKLTIGEYSEREGYKGSEYAPAYEDKDGDLMLVGDVPWESVLSPSLFFCSIFLQTFNLNLIVMYIYIYTDSVISMYIQYVHVILQETQNHERIRSKRVGLWGMRT